MQPYSQLAVIQRRIRLVGSSSKKKVTAVFNWQSQELKSPESRLFRHRQQKKNVRHKLVI